VVHLRSNDRYFIGVQGVKDWSLVHLRSDWDIIRPTDLQFPGQIRSFPGIVGIEIAVPKTPSDTLGPVFFSSSQIRSEEDRTRKKVIANFRSIQGKETKKNTTFDRSRAPDRGDRLPLGEGRSHPGIEAQAPEPRLDRGSCLVGRPISIAVLLYQLRSIEKKKQRRSTPARRSSGLT
jgi:hypothetical protein